MCALLVLLFLGPRAALVFFWLFQTARFNMAFDNIAWPMLGILFLPWTTIMYLIVYQGGIIGWEWFFMILAFIADIASYGGGYRGRGDMRYY